MSYLLNTNVISELVKSKPHPNVLQWFAAMDNSYLYLSVLTFGELRKGIEKLTDLPRKEQLRQWLEIELTQWFALRLLPIDNAVADRWGRLNTQVGKSLSAIDSLVAATALHHDLCLVTRNEQDFQVPLLTVINPWHFNSCQEQP